MNWDALSDLVLAVVTIAIAIYHARRHRGFSVANAAIALAACLGVGDFYGVAVFHAPHEFFSTLATVAAVPLLAISCLGYATNVRTSWRIAFVFFIGLSAIGVVFTVVLPWPLWQQIAPGIALIGLIAFAIRQHDVLIYISLSFLCAAFAVSATHYHAGLFSDAQLLHGLLAMGLWQLSTAMARLLATKIP